MPMGGCDRFKPHFSNYIEKKLDPEITAEMDQHLNNCEKCNKIIHQLYELQSVMAGLPVKKCSEDFNLKLHQRIQSASDRKTSTIKIRRYSYAFSFAVLGLVAAFFITNLMDQKDDIGNNPTMQSYSVDPEPVVPDITVDNEVKDQGEFDIKTKSTSEFVSDSSGKKNSDIENPNIKYVGQEK